MAHPPSQIPISFYPQVFWQLLASSKLTAGNQVDYKMGPCDPFKWSDILVAP